MATRNYLSNVDLKQNELQNAVIQNLASAPSSPKAGQFYFNTTDKTLYVYANGSWVNALTQGTTYTEGSGIDITGNVISADLSASDIPNLSLSKITDVTATAAEVNVLDGITASTAELNILDGVTVTASDINSVTSKIGLTDLSVASGSSNYLGYDNTSGEFSAKVDTTVTASSTNLVTSGAVEAAIGNAIVGGVKYVGTWTATSQTDYSSITLPVKKGYMYLVEGSATITAGGTTIEWNAGDYLLVNADVASGGTLTNVSKIDNTEGSDIVRLNSTQTLTNKTIDADDNTISDLSTSNFKSGVVVTSVGSTGADTSIPTEKAVRSAISSATSGATKKLTAQNGALTASGGQCTWTISNTLATADVEVHVYEASTNSEVFTDVTVGSSTITIKINSSSNISADTYRAVIIG